MLCDQSTHVWLGRFSLRLMQLRPSISWPSAVTRAVQAFALSSDLNPEQMAAIHAAIIKRAARVRVDPFDDHETERESSGGGRARKFLDRLRLQLMEVTR